MPVTTIANVARPRIASHLAERGSGDRAHDQHDRGEDVREVREVAEEVEDDEAGDLVERAREVDGDRREREDAEAEAQQPDGHGAGSCADGEE